LESWAVTVRVGIVRKVKKLREKQRVIANKLLVSFIGPPAELIINKNEK
jgi:hypothetical protein